MLRGLTTETGGKAGEAEGANKKQNEIQQTKCKADKIYYQEMPAAYRGFYPKLLQYFLN